MNDSDYAKKYESMCLNCPLKDRCYLEGEIHWPGCNLVARLGGSKSSLAVTMTLQFKSMELYKWNRSKWMGYDIGWDKTVEEWDLNKCDADFRDALDEKRNDNFINLYKRTMELNSSRNCDETKVLAE